jgi:hypothetical protein
MGCTPTELENQPEEEIQNIIVYFNMRALAEEHENKKRNRSLK